MSEVSPELQAILDALDRAVDSFEPVRLTGAEVVDLKDYIDALTAELEEARVIAVRIATGFSLVRSYELAKRDEFDEPELREVDYCPWCDVVGGQSHKVDCTRILAHDWFAKWERPRQAALHEAQS